MWPSHLILCRLHWSRSGSPVVTCRPRFDGGLDQWRLWCECFLTTAVAYIQLQKGLKGCGEGMAHCIAQWTPLRFCLVNTFRRSEGEPAEELASHLWPWQEELHQVLLEDLWCFGGRTYPSTTSSVTQEFPLLHVLQKYMWPETTWSCYGTTCNTSGWSGHMPVTGCILVLFFFNLYCTYAYLASCDYVTYVTQNAPQCIQKQQETMAVAKDGMDNKLLSKAFEKPPNKYSHIVLELFLT